MNFTLGLILLAVTVAMVLLARPVEGEPARFLKVWIVGQMYVMTAMVSAVMGATIIITTWPL